MQRRQHWTTVLSRNPSCCYIEDDDDDGSGACAHSLDNMESGFFRDHRRPRWSFVNGYLVKGPFIVSSQRFVGRTRYHEDEVEEAMRGEPHFLVSCFLCEKPLRNNNGDIFMYRGDTPFCSEECRQEQIELDQQRERNMNISSSMRALWNKEQQQEGRSNPLTVVCVWAQSPLPKRIITLHPKRIITLHASTLMSGHYSQGYY